MTNAVAMQRVEAAFLFAASVFLYAHFGFSLLWFFPVLLAIDLFALGYLVNSQAGAYVYNFGHSLTIPSVLLVAAALSTNPRVLALGLIWVAHIGMDRALGYGLKLETGFSDTHLGHIGRNKK